MGQKTKSLSHFITGMHISSNADKVGAIYHKYDDIIGLVTDEPQRAQRTQSIYILGSSPIELEKRGQGFQASRIRVFVFQRLYKHF